VPGRVSCLVARLAATGLGCCTSVGVAGDLQLSADIGSDLRWFLQSPAYPRQLEHGQPSLAVRGQLRLETDDRRHQFALVPFYRLDAEDSERTHGDLREAYYRYAGDSVEVLVGAGKVFWGVTESRHLVDIVNQIDGVEDIDEEDKLGQPMVQLSLLRDWGKLDFFVLPLFRERTFPGPAGRLRFEPRVEAARARYEDPRGASHTDLAMRYSHYVGNLDIGVGYFTGTSREPVFVPESDAAGEPVLAPLYTQIDQISIDAQYTAGAWLWKLESFVRAGQGDTFVAAVGGFEYTLFGLRGGGADLGLLVEYLFDDRTLFEAPVTTLENDLFYGARLALNDAADTSVLAGMITDLGNGSTAGLIEARRRFGEFWTAEFEARFFVTVDGEDLLAAFERDSFVNLRVVRYF
jgi:hypothetical protein